MSDPITVHARPVEPRPSGLEVMDLLYIVFRHKWKILICFLLGVAVAAAFYLTNPPTYQSEAKILIRYILENRATLTQGQDATIQSPDPRGENIINSELEILTSLDLARQVAEAVGVRDILAAFGGGDNPTDAAMIIRKGLMVEVPRRSSIIAIRFRHPEARIAQAVLGRLVDTYLQKHVQIHQGIGVLDEFFAKQADEIRSRLAATEEQLNRLRTNAQVISLEDTKRAYAAQVSSIQQDILSAEAELAGHRAALGEWAKLTGGKVDTNTPAETVPPEVAERYRMAVAECEAFRRRETELLMRFAAEHPAVRRIREQISEADSRRRQLEQDNPGVLNLLRPQAVAAAVNTNDLSFRFARVLELEARMKVLTNHLERVRAEAGRVVAAEPAIQQLMRQRDLEEANYRYYNSALEKARVDESLGAGKITNISIIQAPSPPGRVLEDIYKPVGVALGGGLFAGLLLAFVLERVLNQSIKRVVDLERHLRIPIMLSMPDMGSKMKSRPGRDGQPPKLLPPTSGETATMSDQKLAVVRSSGSVAPWQPDHVLRGYFEGLRDRLVTYFETRNMTHKPKLVAVTSCHQGAGVSTLAAGLAATLSETGDGNVLLVDMSGQEGVAQFFHKGEPAVSLTDAFEGQKPQTAMVGENLYLATGRETNDQKLPKVLPKRFASLVPKMKASDYDYIIFDMPPVAQTTVTARLSAYMDMVLMVIESEKTGQELARRANALLQESKANVTAVLNKQRHYMPERLRQEL